MRMLLRSAFLTGILLTLLTLSSFALPVGEQAPDFTLENLSGQTVNLSDYRGRYILLKIGSTQCPTCVEQIKTIREIGNFLKEKDIVFLDVFLRDTKEMIEKSLKGEGFPMTAEALVGDYKVYKAYNVFLIPRVILIDPDLKIVRDGSVWSASDIKRQIDSLENTKPAEDG